MLVVGLRGSVQIASSGKVRVITVYEDRPLH